MVRGPVTKSEQPVTVAVGRLENALERGLLDILRGVRGLEVVGAGLDHAALVAVVARREAQVVILDVDSAAVQLAAGLGNHPAQAAWAERIRTLTRRERDVLELLSDGQTNAEIAAALCISVGTTRLHVKHVYRKLGVHVRGELLGMEL
jgi:DNA-binding CsgD family transcriptional regulator